jgi:hypothetical protein
MTWKKYVVQFGDSSHRLPVLLFYFLEQNGCCVVDELLILHLSNSFGWGSQSLQQRVPVETSIGRINPAV